MTESLFNSPCGRQWQKIGIRQHHGINLPLFCLYSQKSCGIGEIPDLLPVVDWVKEVGMDLLQLLPLNDSGEDASPYNARSSRALNPIFLGLTDLPEIPQNLKSELQELQEFTKEPLVPYAKLRSRKLAWLQDYIAQIASSLRNEPDYQAFIKREAEWLDGYGLFCILKKRFSNQHHTRWDPPFAIPTSKMLHSWIEQEERAIEYHKMVQYFLFQQWALVKKHAENSGVFLMGDLPILISPDSADVWQWPGFFHELLSAGAPPDFYNAEGQNWGFPLYHWKALAQQEFHWWKERLRVADQLFHLVRIDHVVGFFRIWAVLEGKANKEGSFIPYEEKLWLEQGRSLLTMLAENCEMLPIAEDLGAVPAFVRQVLKELGICGTRVMRWERFWQQPGAPFIPTDQYLRETLTTVSTHDSAPLRLWWEEAEEERKLFCHFKGWCEEKILSKKQIFEILRDSHHTPSLFHINLWQEYFSLFEELSDPDPRRERLNIPGKLLPSNWAYRFKQPVEFLTTFAPLKECMRQLLF